MPLGIIEEMRGAIAVAAAVAALAALTVPAAFAKSTPDQRILHLPPAKLTSHLKAVWMGEWEECSVRSFTYMAKQFEMTVPASQTPQQIANRIANRAEMYLYYNDDETAAGVDGCRNGLLWHFYHAPKHVKKPAATAAKKTR